MLLKTKRLDQHATEMFTSEFEKDENLWNIIFESYKNRNAKNESFKRLSELFEMKGEHKVQEGSSVSI